jgi:hypothetical protein
MGQINSMTFDVFKVRELTKGNEMLYTIFSIIENENLL